MPRHFQWLRHTFYSTNVSCNFCAWKWIRLNVSNFSSWCKSIRAIESISLTGLQVFEIHITKLHYSRTWNLFCICQICIVSREFDINAIKTEMTSCVFIHAAHGACTIYVCNGSSRCSMWYIKNWTQKSNERHLSIIWSHGTMQNGNNTTKY